MLFRDSDIIEPVRKCRIEELQTCTVFHGSCDCTDPRILLSEISEMLAENCRIAFVNREFRILCIQINAGDIRMVQINTGDTVIFAGIVLRRLISLALD